MIVKKRLDETIHDKFIEGLYSGRYHAGERIDPAEMADTFSISRTPVVQALKQLANEKVLTVNSSGKFFTLVPTEKMFRDVCNIRCLLEQHAIDILGANPNMEAFERLKDMIRETKKMYVSGDIIGSTTNNLEFHKSFVRETGNQCLYEVYIPVLYQYGGIKYVLGSRWESHVNLEDWHMKIMDYLVLGDIDGAKEMTRFHIELCMEDVLRQIKKTEETV